MRLLTNPNLENSKKVVLGDGEIMSIIYHDIFDYPLSFGELIKWRAKGGLKSKALTPTIIRRKGQFLIDGKDSSLIKKVMKKRVSVRKLKLAKAVAITLSRIPTIEMVGVTGALAMQSADEVSDIDLMIITSKDALWSTRLLTYFMLAIFRVGVRRPGKSNNKDKICLNIWLDESQLKWKKGDRNYYTAHEIAQVVPVFDRGVYSKFISENSWVSDYWPNALRINNLHSKPRKLSKSKTHSIIRFIEPLARKIQLIYMKKKITREVVENKRALFHPFDWGEVVSTRFNTYLK